MTSRALSRSISAPVAAVPAALLCFALWRCRRLRAPLPRRPVVCGVGCWWAAFVGGVGLWLLLVADNTKWWLFLVAPN